MATPGEGWKTVSQDLPEGCRDRDVTAPVKKRQRISLGVWIGLSVVLLLAGGGLWFANVLIRAIERRTAMDNFEKVALAIINHADQNKGKMPTQAIYDQQTGKPLLSWRVAILPQLGEAALYKQIRLDEPWDSPHNRQFWGRMPKAYELPGLPASEGLTATQVFTGPETAFRGPRVTRYPASFQDGTSGTILIVEAAVAVNWMQPEDVDTKYVNPN